MESKYDNSLALIPQYFPKTNLHPRTIEILEQTDSNIAIACSGGPDSTLLLFAIFVHFPHLRNFLHVLHYNHKLRLESDQEAQLIQNIADQLKIHFNYQASEHSHINPNEAELREERHLFFNKILTKINSQTLLLAHHADDVAETFLMRLSRGSSLTGLSAPKPVTRFHQGTLYLRPLLNIPKQNILDTLERAKIPYFIDSSNYSERFFRNKIRKKMIPEWQAATPSNFYAGILRSRMLLEEDDTALNSWLESILCIKKNTSLDLSPLKDKPISLFRRALHRWLLLNHPNHHLNAQVIDRLITKLTAYIDVKISIGNDCFLNYKHNTLSIIKKATSFEWSPMMLTIPSTIFFPQGSHLCAEKIVLSEELREKIFKGTFNPSEEVYINLNCLTHLKLRQWKHGDRYKALGAPGSKKLQDMFMDRKIPKYLRSCVPIVYDSEKGIIWAPGIPIADCCKINQQSTTALRLTYSHKLLFNKV